MNLNKIVVIIQLILINKILTQKQQKGLCPTTPIHAITKLTNQSLLIFSENQIWILTNNSNSELITNQLSEGFRHFQNHLNDIIFDAKEEVFLIFHNDYFLIKSHFDSGFRDIVGPKQMASYFSDVTQFVPKIYVSLLVIDKNNFCWEQFNCRTLYLFEGHNLWSYNWYHFWHIQSRQSVPINTLEINRNFPIGLDSAFSDDNFIYLIEGNFYFKISINRFPFKVTNEDFQRFSLFDHIIKCRHELIPRNILDSHSELLGLPSDENKKYVNKSDQFKSSKDYSFNGSNFEIISNSGSNQIETMDEEFEPKIETFDTTTREPKTSVEEFKTTTKEIETMTEEFETKTPEERTIETFELTTQQFEQKHQEFETENREQEFETITKEFEPQTKEEAFEQKTPEVFKTTTQEFEPKSPEEETKIQNSGSTQMKNREEEFETKTEELNTTNEELVTLSEMNSSKKVERIGNKNMKISQYLSPSLMMISVSVFTIIFILVIVLFWKFWNRNSSQYSLISNNYLNNMSLNWFYNLFK